MKLEVGDYIRTKDGEINKIIEIDTILGQKRYYTYVYNNGNITDRSYYEEDYIKKASYDIIDLIESGDIVNGTEVEIETEGDDIESEFTDSYGNKQEIKSILTHEQYKKHSYKIKGDKHE